MEKHKLNSFIGGWFVGDFQPTILPSKDCEVAIKRYKKGDYDAKHHHKLSDEITVIVDGTVMMNDQVYYTDDVIFIPKGESTDFYAVSDAVTCVVKLPSSKDDKYLD